MLHLNPMSIKSISMSSAVCFDLTIAYVWLNRGIGITNVHFNWIHFLKNVATSNRIVLWHLKLELYNKSTVFKPAQPPHSIHSVAAVCQTCCKVWNQCLITAPCFLLICTLVGLFRLVKTPSNMVKARKKKIFYVAKPFGNTELATLAHNVWEIRQNHLILAAWNEK